MTGKGVEYLSHPFRPEEIEWRIQSAGYKKDGTTVWALAVPYIDNRAAMNRLDEAFGIDGWQNEITPVVVDNKLVGFLCTLKIKVDNEWISKTDGAPLTDVEPFKGGISDSMKRAFVQLGGGRDLYEMDAVFVETGSHCLKRDKFKTKDATGKEKAVFFKWNPPGTKTEQTTVSPALEEAANKVKEEFNGTDVTPQTLPVGRFDDAKISISEADSAAKLLKLKSFLDLKSWKKGSDIDERATLEALIDQKLLEMRGDK